MSASTAHHCSASRRPNGPGSGLARTFQRLELFTSLTVRENIRVAGEIRNRWSIRRRAGIDVTGETERIISLLGLEAVAEREVAEIPTGQARIVELGRALMTRPRLLLLDEPASGQDDNETEQFGALLRRLNSDGMTILLVEHDMSLVMSVCDHVHVLDFGSIIASGTTSRGPDRSQGPRRLSGSVVTRRDRPVLELVGVRAGYGPIEILHGVDLTLHEGEVYALLGPNGGGKSTTLKVCSGLLPVIGGEMRFAGKVLNDVSPDALARLGVCTIPEGKGVFPNLTVRENLLIMTHTGASMRRHRGRGLRALSPAR